MRLMGLNITRKAQQQQDDGYINELYKAIYAYLSKGSNLINKDNLAEIVKHGYVENIDVYSIINYIVSLHTNVNYELIQTNKNGDQAVVTGHPLNDILNRPNSEQSFRELIEQMWVIYYASGNGMLYVPRYEAGNNAGQLITNIGMHVAPAHQVECVTDGWAQPVRGYKFKIGNTQHEIDRKEMLHIKFTNPNFDGAQDKMGMSPLRAAADLIMSQNLGYNITSETYKNRVPIGILTKKSPAYNETTAVKELEALRDAYRKRIKGNSEPILTHGDVSWQQIAISNLRDLAIVEQSQDGLRKLCNLYGVPSTVMNDIAGRTFNNQFEAKKQTYEVRVMPDIAKLLEKINSELVANYGADLKIVARYDHIPALQSNKSDQVTWVTQLLNAGAITHNEARELMGLPIEENPTLDSHYISAGVMPMDMIEQQMSDNYLNANNVNDYQG